MQALQRRALDPSNNQQIQSPNHARPPGRRKKTAKTVSDTVYLVLVRIFLEIRH